MNIDELKNKNKRTIYSRGEFSAVSDDFLAYVYTIIDILSVFEDEEDARQWILTFGNEQLCYTVSGHSFREKEILDAIRMRKTYLREIEKIKSLLSFWEDNKHAVP